MALLPDAVLTVDSSEYGDWSLAADVSGIEWTEGLLTVNQRDRSCWTKAGPTSLAAIGESSLADYLIDLTIERIEDSHAEGRAPLETDLHDG